MTTRSGSTAAPRRGYVIGTNFSGSTVFGQALGAHSSVSYLGEVDRVVRFGPTRWADEPDPQCHYCEVRGESCPVWTEQRVAAARTTAYGDLMGLFEAELGMGYELTREVAAWQQRQDALAQEG